MWLDAMSEKYSYIEKNNINESYRDNFIWVRRKLENSEHIRGFWYKNMRGIRMEWGDFGIFLPPHRNEGIKDKGVLNSNNNPLSPDILSIV